MIREEALKLIQKTAVDAAGAAARIFHVESDPDYIYWMALPDGTLTKVHAEPSPLACKMFDFVSLVGMAYGAIGDDKAFPSIWYSETGVELVMGVGRRHRAKIVLTPSPAFAMLREWKRSGGFSTSHKGIYQMLRTTFADCLPSHPDLRQLVSRVDISKVQKLNSEQTKTKVSLDRSMMSEAAGAEKLPDVLTFTVPAFAEPIAPIMVKVRVAFELDADDAAFKFVVLPQEIHEAVGLAEDYLYRQIGNTIAEILNPKTAGLDASNDGVTDFVSKCPVYRGTP